MILLTHSNQLKTTLTNQTIFLFRKTCILNNEHTHTHTHAHLHIRLVRISVHYIFRSSPNSPTRFDYIPPFNQIHAQHRGQRKNHFNCPVFQTFCVVVVFFCFDLFSFICVGCFMISFSLVIVSNPLPAIALSRPDRWIALTRQNRCVSSHVENLCRIEPLSRSVPFRLSGCDCAHPTNRFCTLAKCQKTTDNSIVLSQVLRDIFVY